MRILRTVAPVLAAALIPLSSGRAQTCQGTASFADGKAQIGAGYANNDNFSMWNAGLNYGAPKAWYGGVEVDGTTLAHSGGSYTGFGGMVGYQIPIEDSGWEFCPAVTGHYASFHSLNTTSFGLNGSIGYRIAANDNFAVVPAAGLQWISSNTSGGGGNTTNTNIAIGVGLIANKVWSFVPGVLIPTQSGAKTSWTIGVAYNFAK